MHFNPDTWKTEARNKKKENKQFLDKTRRIRGIEKKLPGLHDEAFEKINCLDCAGCCKTISPRFKHPDIHRISKYLGMKAGEMIDQYLRLDEDGDYVVKNSPCPFLDTGNYCKIYDVRPRDCERYPYTDSDDFFNYPGTTLLNTTTCPAVFHVLERLKEITLQHK